MGIKIRINVRILWVESIKVDDLLIHSYIYSLSTLSKCPLCARHNNNIVGKTKGVPNFRVLSNFIDRNAGERIYLSASYSPAQDPALTSLGYAKQVIT